MEGNALAGGGGGGGVSLKMGERKEIICQLEKGKENGSEVDQIKGSPNKY